MKSNASVFDLYWTRHELENEIQKFAKDLLYAGKKNKKAAVLDDSARINLEVLTGLSYAELKHHPRPVYVLSEICRLLIKTGDIPSFNLVSSISHRIYILKCKLKESWYISYLYKGIAQIGTGFADIGIKNVLFGMYEQMGFTVVPVDKALGYRALTSAAIISRNLKMAQQFAREWLNQARLGGLEGEAVCARMAVQILCLICGTRENYHKYSASSDQYKVPENLKGMEKIIKEWTQAAISGKSYFPGNYTEPCPLFIGIDWLIPQISEDNYITTDFRYLCRLRQIYSSEEDAARLPVAEIEKYANIAASWELSGPLGMFERVLSEKDRDVYHKFTMTRMFGKEVMEQVLSRASAGPDVSLCHDSIILAMDVRKYSAICEGCSPDEIFDILNPLFKIMHEELEKAGGTILEYIGDAIIVIFNIFGEFQSEIKEILYRVVRCMKRIRTLSALSMKTGLPEISIGVGINRGSVAVGYIGGLSRCSLTVLGNTINLAARFEAATKEFPGNILISKACFESGDTDVWKTPRKVNYAVRNLGKQQMRNIQEPVHVLGLRPLMQYQIDFVPMGFVAEPEKGAVYIDTGNSVEPGIIDHHFEEQTAQSACELLLQKPELLLDHLGHIPESKREFRLHIQPDMDCAATFYCACELLDQFPREKIMEKLAQYSSLIDQGHIPRPDLLKYSLYGIFLGHQEIMKKTGKGFLSDYEMLEAGLRVIDAAVWLMEQDLTRNFSDIFQYRSDWFSEEQALIKNDRIMYKKDRKTGHTYKARINGLPEPVTGLWLDHPQSCFFKLWARTDPDAPDGKGYDFLSVDFSVKKKNRFIISVPPDSGTDLNGLGQLLEVHETQKRKKLGRERPREPVRIPSDNSDPWYFGQGHEYTIIDGPRNGTILTAPEVEEIHQAWNEIK